MNHHEIESIAAAAVDSFVNGNRKALAELCIERGARFTAVVCSMMIEREMSTSVNHLCCLLDAAEAVS